MDATATRVNLTPHTTMIVKSAMAMEGGLTAENLAIATEAVTSKLNFGLDTSTVADPMTSAVTNDNITEVVLSSEVFGEMARRSAYWIGGDVTEDDIFAALAADLSDSALGWQRCTRYCTALHRHCAYRQRAGFDRGDGRWATSPQPTSK